MTSITSVPAQSTNTARPPDSRRKDVLFCPDCGHESPLGGDWLVDDTRDGRQLCCPECHHILVER